MPRFRVEFRILKDGVAYIEAPTYEDAERLANRILEEEVDWNWTEPLFVVDIEQEDPPKQD